MGIGMTCQAVFQFKMGLAFMAHGALGDDILTPGRMLLVTVQTGYFRPMLAAVACY